jgi:hypothetical protein
MKKILNLVWGIALLSLVACSGIDNWDEPDCTFFGTVIDSYTGEPLLASQNEWQIRIWEKSWTGHEEGATNYQELRIKQDGTYQNTKLFAGTYDMLPFDGPFWPMDTVQNVVLSSSTKQDFTVTPYLQIIDFETELGTWDYGTASAPDVRPALTFYCRIRAPRRDGLPNIRDIQAFLSRTTFCGNGTDSRIDIAEYRDNVDDNASTTFDERGTKGRIAVNRNWGDACRWLDPTWTDSDTSPRVRIGPLPVNSGYTYYVRMGASTNVGNNRFNYSPIVQVVVP